MLFGDGGIALGLQSDNGRSVVGIVLGLKGKCLGDICWGLLLGEVIEGVNMGGPGDPGGNLVSKYTEYRGCSCSLISIGTYV